MRTFFYRKLRRLGAAVVSLLCFASCSPSLDSDADEFQYMTAYGSPNATYRMVGSVKDDSGKPLKGIQVVSTFGESTWMRRDTTYTDSDGHYSSYMNTYPAKTVTVDFNDVDGADNGGEFESKSVTVDPVQIEKGKGWNTGVYKVESDVRLKKK